MPKHLYKTKVSFKDLNKIQTYLREFCNDYYFKAWESRNKFMSTVNDSTCIKSDSYICHPDLYLDNIILTAKKFGYPFVDIVATINGIGTATVVRIMEDDIRYGCIFLKYARAYADMKGYKFE